MPVLREDSVLIMDGAVKLYRRERSRKWQAAFQIDGQYIRISTGKSNLDEAIPPMLVEQPASNQLALHLANLLPDLPSLGSVLTPLLKLVLGELPMTKVRY